tara:strand:- start:33 stop:407 length:375 start_codon:yes stop_codon:yes gene_type:complete
MNYANPYPLMFSGRACIGDSPVQRTELPEWYKSSNTYRYSDFEREDHFYNDSNFFGNPFESPEEDDVDDQQDNNYNVLGLKRSASQEDIKMAFREKALETHPDKIGGDGKEFQEIRAAYECLVQ